MRASLAARLAGLAVAGALGLAGRAQAAVGRSGIPQPMGTWWGDEAGEPEPGPEGNAILPAFAALVAGGEPDAAEAPAEAPPAAVALHPAISRGALPRPLVNTAGSFSAAAWVRLDDCAVGRAVAVAQGGNHASAFALGFVAGNYALTTTLADEPEATERHHWAAIHPVQGEWTHLVGVFDARGGQLRLYIDGELAASAPAPKMWAAERATTIGRGQVAGSWSEAWPGDIEDVRIFATALTDANVHALHQDQPGN